MTDVNSTRPFAREQETLPPVEVLRELFELRNDGTLYHRPRDRRFFKSDHNWNSWNRQFPGRRAGAVSNSNGYRHVCILRRQHCEHRVIFKMAYGYEPVEVDHENGDRTDNRPENLKPANRGENNKNMPLQRNSKHGAHGIFYSCRKWKARIVLRGKTIYLGKFSTKDEAIAARKQAEAKYGFNKNHGRRQTTVG